MTGSDGRRRRVLFKPGPVLGEALVGPVLARRLADLLRPVDRAVAGETATHK